jgi:hypothetical protein
MDKIIKHVREKEFMAYQTAYNDFIMKYFHGNFERDFLPVEKKSLPQVSTSQTNT